MFMLDLCAGTGSASRAMARRGWQVVTVDLDPATRPEIVADVRGWSWDGPRPDLVWASPPCVEFSRESMPWSKTGQDPDLSIVLACLRIIAESEPRYWVLENVRGAKNYFERVVGVARAIYGPFYLWGNFPALGDFRLEYRKKQNYGGRNRAIRRAAIPARLGEALAVVIEHELGAF